jgi:uncharacterized protein YndB with AHSA1/START domain
MRFEQRVHIRRSAEDVFDYVTDPANLAAWQTHKTRVEPLTEGPPRLGTRVREWTKPPGMKEYEQVVEFTEFERPNRLHVHIVDGPQPVDGTWTFAVDGAGGTEVHCVVEGELRGPARFVGPLVARGMARQFRGYHEQLRKNLEARN